MKFGLEIAPWGALADPRRLALLAAEAEAAGWDGVFVWDAMLHDEARLPKADPWIALAAIAMRTERIRLGTMVTPLARRRPWKVARETVTLDYLSNGRVILGVGLGDPSDEEFAWFDEAGRDYRTRAAMLDEGLEILDGLWSGEPFGFAGEHYRLAEMTFAPRPVQRPRIPIWVGGWWPNRAPLRRAVRWDGFHPGKPGDFLTAGDVREITAAVARERPASAPFDLAVQARVELDRSRAADNARELANAGATWWMEKAGTMPNGAIECLVQAGPPRW